jgi:hypothetical protein
MVKEHKICSEGMNPTAAPQARQALLFGNRGFPQEQVGWEMAGLPGSADTMAPVSGGLMAKTKNQKWWWIGTEKRCGELASAAQYRIQEGDMTKSH